VAGRIHIVQVPLLLGIPENSGRNIKSIEVRKS
jgi:hypothetical protein